MTRVYNFSAGPACLPEWVLKKAANEMLDAHNSGMSVMEMSHRSSEFQDIIDTCKARLKRLMNIPDEYENIGDENRNGIPDEYDDFDDFEPHFNSDEK